MRVKICGVTRAEDAAAAEAAGADAIGLNFAPRSKRYLTLDAAAQVLTGVGPFISRVGVFVDSPLKDVRAAVYSLRLDAVQLNGAESRDFAATLRKQVWVIRAVSFSPELQREHLEAYPADAILLDGLDPGSGQAFDWTAAAALYDLPRLILAGGLTADNVQTGIRSLRPYAVDVASGVEAGPGIKDAAKIQDFVRLARAA